MPTLQEPPAYVIGPATHVGHALNALMGFHTNRVEATVMSVMDSAMVGALSIRRAEPIGNVLTVSQSYEVSCAAVACGTQRVLVGAGVGMGVGVGAVRAWLAQGGCVAWEWCLFCVARHVRRTPLRSAMYQTYVRYTLPVKTYGSFCGAVFQTIHRRLLLLVDCWVKQTYLRRYA